MIDTTQINTYARCPRAYYNKFVRQIKKSTIDEGEMTRNFGQCIHKALEIWQKEGSLDKGITWFKTNYMNMEGENVRTVANGVILLQEYVKWEQTNFPGAKTIGIEILGSYKIGEIDYTVKIDRVIEYNGNRYCLDYKTTTAKTHYYFLQFSPNLQVSAYCNYVMKRWGQCSGFIPCAMQMGWLDRGVYIKGDDNRIFSNVSNKYHIKLKQELPYATGFWCKFDYDIVNRNQEQLEDFECQVNKWMVKIKTSEQFDSWPKAENACNDFKGCGYRPLCISCDDESVLENMYRKYDSIAYLTKKEGE